MITAEMFAQSQGLAFGEMLSFLRKGDLPAKIARRDAGRKDRITLTPAQVADFHANFSSFRRLSSGAGLSWIELEDRLHEQGIAPFEGCLRIYRGEEIDPLLHRAPTPQP